MFMSVKRIKPAQQGELDGACGFYSIVNAIHLLEPDLPRDMLFTQTISAFLHDGDPMRFVHGTNRGTIKNTLSRLLSYLHENYDFYHDKSGYQYQFKFSLPYWSNDKDRSRKDVLNILEESSFKKGKVCIIGYGNQEEGYDHWTVVKQAKKEHLITHDSSEESAKIELSQLRVDSTQNSNVSRPYNLYTKDLIIIEKITIKETT